MKINSQNLQTTVQFNVGQKKIASENTIKDEVILGESREKPDFLKRPMVNLKSMDDSIDKREKAGFACIAVAGGLGGLFTLGIGYSALAQKFGLIGLKGAIGLGAAACILAAVGQVIARGDD